jgi:hypothetical protein
MKRKYFFLLLILLVGFQISAQINPGNPKHQWTFDDGTANDAFGSAHGTISGAATISRKALNTTLGGYLNLPGATIAVNTLTALTQEVWFTSTKNANTASTTLTFFGNANVDGWKATNYLFLTPARYENVSRTAISCLNTSSPWTTETQVNGTKYDDGALHHLVSVINNTDLSLYIDGVFVGTTALSTDNKLSNLSNAYVFLARSGETYQATWKGKVHKFSIFDKELNAQEILFLYQQGAEAGADINVTTNNFLFETGDPVQVKVTGFNLTPGENITISAPAGINLSTNSLPYNATNAALNVIWDETTTVDGNIVFTSGTTIKEIPVKTASGNCFVPLYNDRQNLIPDPKMFNIGLYSGWGAKEMVDIVSEPANVYCGISTAKVGNGTTTSGSMEVVLNGKVQPNTSYRIKAMVKTIGGDFQLGIWGLTQNQISNNINTNGEWQTIDFVFKTAATLQPNQYMWWNNSGRSGLYGYIDNWEMYDVSDIVSNVMNTTEDPLKIYFVHNFIVAEFENKNASKAELNIYEVNGRSIFNKTFSIHEGKNSLSIEKILPTGVFIVKINTGNKIYFNKLIK